MDDAEILSVLDTSKSVRIKNIPESLDKKRLKAENENIEHIVIQVKAFVLFKTSAGAQKAAKDGIKYEGKTLKCIQLDDEPKKTKPKEVKSAPRHQSQVRDPRPISPTNDSTFTNVTANFKRDVKRSQIKESGNARITEDDQNGLTATGTLEDIRFIERGMKNLLRSVPVTLPVDFWEYICKSRGSLLKNIDDEYGVEFAAENSASAVLVTAPLCTPSTPFASSSDALLAIRNMYDEMKVKLTRETIHIDGRIKPKSLDQYLKEIHGMYYNLLVKFLHGRNEVSLYGKKKVVAQAKQDLEDLLNNDIDKNSFNQMIGSVDHLSLSSPYAQDRQQNYAEGASYPSQSYNGEGAYNSDKERYRGRGRGRGFQGQRKNEHHQVGGDGSWLSEQGEDGSCMSHGEGSTFNNSFPPQIQNAPSPDNQHKVKEGSQTKGAGNQHNSGSYSQQSSQPTYAEACNLSRPHWK